MYVKASWGWYGLLLQARICNTILKYVQSATQSMLPRRMVGSVVMTLLLFICRFLMYFGCLVLSFATWNAKLCLSEHEVVKNIMEVLSISQVLIR